MKSKLLCVQLTILVWAEPKIKRLRITDQIFNPEFENWDPSQKGIFRSSPTFDLLIPKKNEVCIVPHTWISISTA